MVQKTLLLILLMLAGYVASHAQSADDAPQLLATLSRTYAGQKAYHFEIAVLSRQRPMSGHGYEWTSEWVEVTAASASGKKRVECSSNNLSVMLIDDGKTEWVFVPRARQFSRKGIDGLPGPADRMIRNVGQCVAEFAGLLDILSQPRMLPEETLEFNGEKVSCRVVQGQRDTNQPDPTIVTLWIDKRSHLVRKVNYKSHRPEANGSIWDSNITHTYRVARAGEPADPKFFEFTPPSGAKEVDVIAFEGMEVAPPARRPATADIVGRMAVDFTLKDLVDQPVSLKDLRGKVVLLNFWASWCGPCRMEMPHIEKLHRRLKDKDVVILGIDDEKPAVAKDFLKKNAYTFRSLVDDQRRVAGLYGVNTIPQVFVLDRDGRVVTHYVGARTQRDLEAALVKAGLEGKSFADTPVAPSRTVSDTARQPTALGSNDSSASATSGAPVLAAPKPIAPLDGAVFHHYPRQTVLQWEELANAVAYKVEIDFLSETWRSESGKVWLSSAVQDTYYAFKFVGAQPGRWRVWAVARDGSEGPKSDWQGFRYTK